MKLPTDQNWVDFKSSAREEGWTVPDYEIDLLRSVFADAAYSLHVNGHYRGFVSAVAHEKSGWIGNLVVPREARGKGYGRILFEKAVETLEQKNLASLWLTASEMGQPLYEQYGFREIGSVDRYLLTENTITEKRIPPCPVNVLNRFDRSAWQETRGRLLAGICRSGQAFACDQQSVALLQTYRDVQIIGPWYAHEASDQQLQSILASCLCRAAADIPIVVDLINSHPAKKSLLESGFRFAGHNKLMVKGCHDHIGHDSLVALASLGSMG